MKGKKATKPVEPIEDEALTADDVFGTLPEAPMPSVREDQPEALASEDSETDNVISMTLGIAVPKVSVPAPGSPDPPYRAGSGPDTVDGYVRSQVLREMYGTDTPSEHDKMQLALRKML